VRPTFRFAFMRDLPEKKIWPDHHRIFHDDGSQKISGGEGRTAFAIAIFGPGTLQSG
jgi:hypothetical protein